jgi:hypothetical protein
MENDMRVDPEGAAFVEFRRKVRDAEVLSPAMERVLDLLNFTGKLSVVVQNGRVLKSGYEEGYFRRRDPARGSCAKSDIKQ